MFINVLKGTVHPKYSDSSPQPDADKQISPQTLDGHNKHKNGSTQHNPSLQKLQDPKLICRFHTSVFASAAEVEVGK